MARGSGDGGIGARAPGRGAPVAAWVAVARAVAARPELWPTALRQGRRLVSRGWWHRWPGLPLPDRDYLAFRSVTQYGDAGARPDPDDVVSYLRWCRQWAAVVR